MFLALFVFGSIHVIGGANISIESFGCISGNKCGCNENITIMCTIAPYQKLLYWRADGQTIAQCSASGCASLVNEYHFDFDQTGGRSNLTFLPLRLDHQGVVFQCDEAGPDRDQFTATVDVSVDENDFNTDTNTTDGNLELAIHCEECVPSPDTISFEWMVSKEVSTTETYTFEAIFGRTPNKITVACAYSENPNCGGNETSKISSSIQIQNNTGTPHYVFVAVSQNENLIKKFRMPGVYLINVTTQCSDDQILCDNVCMVKCDCPIYKNTTECKGPLCTKLDNECLAVIFAVLAALCFVIVCITLISAKCDPEDEKCGCCCRCCGVLAAYLSYIFISKDKHSNEVNDSNTDSKSPSAIEERMENCEQLPPIVSR